MFYILAITILTGVVLAVVGAVVIGLSVLSIWLSNKLTTKSTLGILITILINCASLIGCIAYTISGFGDNSYFFNFSSDAPLFFLIPMIYGSIVSLFPYLAVKFWRRNNQNTSIRVSVSLAFVLLGCLFLMVGFMGFLFFFAQAGGHAVF